MKTPASLPIALSILLSLTTARALSAEEAHDPLEPMNRGIFWFNERVDLNLIGPVADGYDYIMPEPAQVGVTNFFKNLRYPTYLLSDLLQAEFDQALEHTGRFLINTTIGLFGFIDVAKDLGLEEKREDFGLAFASWGIPAGPYIVLPILGPSNVRDTVGLVFDTLTSPTYMLGYTDMDDDAVFWTAAGLTTTQALQWRVNLDDAIRAGREGSLDYYLFVQSSYYQYRTGQIMGGNPSQEEMLNSGAVNIDAELDAITATESGGKDAK